jgi:hypothetical protein
LGVAKVYVDRASWYVSKIQMLMVAFLYFDRVGWNWWYLTALVMLPIVFLIERKWILPQESAYLRKKGGYAGKEDLSKP